MGEAMTAPRREALEWIARLALERGARRAGRRTTGPEDGPREGHEERIDHGKD